MAAKMFIIYSGSMELIVDDMIHMIDPGSIGWFISAPNQFVTPERYLKRLVEEDLYDIDLAYRRTK